MVGKMDEDAARISYELQYCQKQAEEIERQLGQLQMLLQENSSTQAALDALLVAGDAETISPLGGGVFFKAKILDSKKVLVDVGGRVIVEKTIQDAKAVLEQRRKTTLDTAARLEKNFEEVGRRMQALSQAAQNAHGHPDHKHVH